MKKSFPILEELGQHKLAYIILFMGLSVASFLFLWLWPDRFWLRVAAVGIGVFYVFWGVITHLHHDHISRDVVVEYLAVGTLASVLLVLITV